MTSISDFEARDLLAKLAEVAARPEMYGWPEEVEAVGKHLLHVALTLVRPGWTFQETARLWEQVVMDVGVGPALAVDREAHRLSRWNRWGDRTQQSFDQVRDAFARIWAAAPRSMNHPKTASWIEELLAHPDLAGAPDQLESVLFVLVFLAFAGEGFRDTYRRECDQVGGDAVRSLADVGPDREWYQRRPLRPVEFKSYPEVVAVIREAAARVAQLANG